MIRLAFISFGKLKGTDGHPDFIALCEACTKGGSKQCRNEVLTQGSRLRECQAGLDIQACTRMLYSGSASDTRRRRAQGPAALNEVFACCDPDIVMVNELGIPATIHGPGKQLFRWVSDLAIQHEALIIAGSFHDARTKYNTGYVFSPNASQGWAAFHKQVSAQDIGEVISVPGTRHSMIVSALDLHVAVITCLDLLDYSTIVPLISMRLGLDFILVPSHSEYMDTLDRAAMLASAVLPGVVGIANYDHGAGKSGSLFVFGERCAAVKDQPLTQAAGWLTTYEVPWASVVAGKKKALSAVSKELEWLLVAPAIERA